MWKTLALRLEVGDMREGETRSQLSGLTSAWRDKWRATEKSASKQSSQTVVRARIPKGTVPEESLWASVGVREAF